MIAATPSLASVLLSALTTERFLGGSVVEQALTNLRGWPKAVQMTSKIRCTRLQPLLKNSQPIAAQNLLDVSVTESAFDQSAGKIPSMRMIR
jgi:hypothetical protein